MGCVSSGITLARTEPAMLVALDGCRGPRGPTKFFRLQLVPGAFIPYELWSRCSVNTSRRKVFCRNWASFKFDLEHMTLWLFHSPGFNHLLLSNAKASRWPHYAGGRTLAASTLSKREVISPDSWWPTGSSVGISGGDDVQTRSEMPVGWRVEPPSKSLNSQLSQF
jgi:hypothetical protein